MLLLTGLAALGFALIHLLIGRLRFLEVVPRSRWLSFAGGVAVAYVFLHILPDLAAHQQTFAQALGVAPRTAERWVYLVALAGLAVFYGLERAVRRARGRWRTRPGAEPTASGAFWLHVGSFTLYNMLIGYLLLHREEQGVTSLLTYFVAMALHFVTNDFGLRQDHEERYDRIARWPIAAAVLVGWALGTLVEVPALALGALFAFLAGGVMLNVLKEELPEERQSRFWPFVLGAAGYAALQLAG